jgi:glycosyltransferase involved in cell wall biosynthesis
MTSANGHVTEPFVSVIVPVRNRAACVRQLLDALIDQSYASARYEVIVVDNESTEDIASIVREAAARAPFEMRYLRKHNDGPAASRNRGAEMARGDILAFTDSDCIPDRDWLAHGARAFEPDGVGVACGPIAPVEITRRDPFFVHQILPVTREEGLYPTANVFYRRDCFTALGGFDETLRTYAWGQPVGGDDTEFAWRVRRAGWASAFVDGARVRHQASKVRPHEYVLNSLQAQILPRVVRTAPELRETSLYRRYFVHKNSVLFLLFAAGAVLAPKRRGAAVLMLPWLRATWPVLRMDAWPPARWPRAALRLVLHVVAAGLLEGALLWGSIKNRRVVL